MQLNVLNLVVLECGSGEKDFSRGFRGGGGCSGKLSDFDPTMSDEDFRRFVDQVFVKKSGLFGNSELDSILR